MSLTTVSIDLDDVHATVVRSRTGRVVVGLNHGAGSVSLHGQHEVVRQVLTDAVAQLDAIAAQHIEEAGQ